MKNKILSMLVLTTVLSGCQQINNTRAHYVRDFSRDYMTASLAAPLKIPENLSTPEPTENYPLPEGIPSPGSVKPPSLIPPGFDIS